VNCSLHGWPAIVPSIMGQIRYFPCTYETRCSPKIGRTRAETFVSTDWVLPFIQLCSSTN